MGKPFISVLSLFTPLISVLFPPAFILPFATVHTNPFFYASVSFHLVFSPTCKPLFLLAKLSHLPALLPPQTCLPLTCFNPVPPPRTKRFLYRSALALYKPGWCKVWRESQQEEANVMGLVGAQSSKCTRASTEPWDAAVMVGN